MKNKFTKIGILVIMTTLIMLVLAACSATASQSSSATSLSQSETKLPQSSSTLPAASSDASSFEASHSSSSPREASQQQSSVLSEESSLSGSQSEVSQWQSSASPEVSSSSNSQSEISQQQSSASTSEQPEPEWNGYYDWISYDNREYARFAWSYEQSELGESLGKVTAYGLDSLNSIIYKTNFEAFAIKGVLSKEGIAVKVKVNGETWYAPFFAQEQSFITGERFADYAEQWR